MSTQVIARNIHNGHVYLSTEYRGVAYVLRRSKFGWELSTRRLSLGRMNMGGLKRFDTLEAVRAGCKAFAAVDLMDAV